MAELRRDPITGRWVIINTDNPKGPGDFKIEEEKVDGKVCPFCEGSENLTPPEVNAYGKKERKPNTPGWTLRVVPNKYPALSIKGEIDREGMGMYDMSKGIGAHEVIIDSPSHDKEIPDLPIKSVEDIIWSYSDRSLDLRKDPRLKYILIFRNIGRSAGASLEHPHSQVIALPIVPKRVMGELEGSRWYYGYKERCVFCDMIKQESQDKELTIAGNESFLSFSPYAPRFPYEVWIIPKKHGSDFGYIQKNEVADLARILQETLRRIGIVLKNPSYNYLIHTSPLDGGRWRSCYHWHIEIMPRLTHVAGFEWGTGFYINPTPPEFASRTLREAKI